MAGCTRLAAAPNAVTGCPATGSGPPTGMYDHSSSTTRATWRTETQVKVHLHMPLSASTTRDTWHMPARVLGHFGLLTAAAHAKVSAARTASKRLRANNRSLSCLSKRLSQAGRLSTDRSADKMQGTGLRQ